MFDTLDIVLACPDDIFRWTLNDLSILEQHHLVKLHLFLPKDALLGSQLG